MGVNYVAIPVRPAGAGWSSAHDMLRYIAMKFALGRLPDSLGTRPLSGATVRASAHTTA